MGLVAMSAGRMTLATAAHVLDLSPRQIRRLLARMRTDGGVDPTQGDQSAVEQPDQ